MTRALNSLAAILAFAMLTPQAFAATATVRGNANTDSANRPFFTAGGPLGFSGSIASNGGTSSNVTGVALQAAGTATLPDLSDGNGLPLGVTAIYNISFTVSSLTAGTLNDGGNGGLAIRTASETAASGDRGLINAATGEGLLFNNPQVTSVTFIDPLGIISPCATGSNLLFRAMRSPDHVEPDIATDPDVIRTSSDAAGNVDFKIFDDNPNAIEDDYEIGSFTPKSTVYIATTAGEWRLKGIGYQLDVNYTVAPAPATRRTFKFADIPLAYDDQPSHSITDSDTSVTIAAAGPGALLDTNEIAVGVNSTADDAVTSEGGQRRIDGTLGESLLISFDRDVNLESLTIGAFDADGIETMVLSYVSGTNPFHNQTGYSTDYTFGANSVSYKKTDIKNDSPNVVTFGIGAQEDVLISAGTVLALTGSPVTSNGILLDMITVNVEAPVGLPGDYNSDGSVDAADYVLWRKGGPLVNEIDTPGTVNQADYTEWRARFGNSGSGSGMAGANIPEPSTLLLLAALPLTMLRRATRRA